MDKKPLVSVVMITYGHEKFIRQAMEGVLMQECDFDVELIIANDCSPDNTDFVVKDVLETHPKASWIRYEKHSENIGMIPNFIFALQKAQGEYIAFCEGDDYWTDAMKLQKQVDFLENNPKYIACQHDRLLLRDGTFIEERCSFHIFTQCFVFRNIIDGVFFKYLQNVFNGDTFLEFYLRLFGEIKFLDFIGAVYRITGCGAYTSLDLMEKKRRALNSYKQILKMQYAISNNKTKQQSKVVQSYITSLQFDIFLLDRSNKKEMFRYFFYVFRYNRCFFSIEYKRLCRCVLIYLVFMMKKCVLNRKYLYNYLFLIKKMKKVNSKLLR